MTIEVNNESGYEVDEAEVAALARYVLDLRSITGGRADLTMTPDHYDILPSHLVPAGV